MPYLKWFSLDCFMSINSVENEKIKSNDNKEDVFIPFDFNKDRAIINDFLKGDNTSYVQRLTATDAFNQLPSEIVQFRQETRCVTALYEVFFEKFKTERCSEVIVRCVEKVTNNHIPVFDGSAEVQVLFDFNQYFKSTNEEKKKFALEALQTGVERVAKEFGWDLKPFLVACEGVKSRNYRYAYVYNKPKYSPNRKHVAEVVCTHDVSSFKIEIVINDKSGKQIKRQHIITEDPIEFFYERHLGNLRWISNEEVEFTNQLEKESWKIQL